MKNRESLQEIRENLPLADLCSLSANEKMAWSNDDVSLSRNHALYELRAIKKLLDQVADSTKKNVHQKKILQLFKEYTALQSFHFDRRFEQTTLCTATRLEQLSVELGMFDVAQACTKILINILYRHNRRHECKSANMRAKKYIRITKLELDVLNFYSKIENHLQKKVVLDSNFFNKIERKSLKYKKLLNEIDSNGFQFTARLIIAIATRRKSNYMSFLADSLDYFKNKKSPFRRGVMGFSIMLSQSLLNRDRLEEARELVDSTIAESKIKDHNYYRLKEIKLKIALREFDVKSVTELIDFFYFKRGVVSKTILQRVSMYKMYAAIIAGKTESARIKRTINKLHELSTDKQGVNLALIICELLINIARFNYDYIEDTHDSVNNYIKRHNLRFTKEAAFIKLIQSVRYIREHEKFETVAAERLHKMSLSVSLEPDLEIINYSDLWHFIMDSRIKMIDGRQIVV